MQRDRAERRYDRLYGRQERRDGSSAATPPQRAWVDAATAAAAAAAPPGTLARHAADNGVGVGIRPLAASTAAEDTALAALGSVVALGLHGLTTVVVRSRSSTRRKRSRRGKASTVAAP